MKWTGLLFVALIVLAILNIVPWWACLIVPATIILIWLGLFFVFLGAAILNKIA